MNERVLRNNEYIEHVEKNVLVLRTPSYNELDVTIFWNIALVINNALDVTIVRSSDRQIVYVQIKTSTNSKSSRKRRIRSCLRSTSSLQSLASTSCVPQRQNVTGIGFFCLSLISMQGVQLKTFFTERLA